MRSYSKPRDVGTLIKSIEKNEIILDTSIQRKADQWDRKKKSLLILSAIQEIVIPEIFAKEIKKETKNGKGKIVFEILDGKQRLTVLKSFCDDEFKLDKSLPEEYANKKFSELDEDTQAKVKAAVITINVYQDITEEETEIIFCRLNNGQKLSNDNIYRAHMGQEFRTFIDEAINKPFFEKTALTKGQLKKSEDQGVVLSALGLITDNGISEFSKNTMMAFVDNFKDNYNADDTQKILDALDWLDTVIEEKNKYLKKISLPMIIAVAAICDDSKKATYANNLKSFLADYENRTDYLQYCNTATTNSANVAGRLEYFKKMMD